LEDFFMAYKFQFGAATLSGSVTLKQSATMQGGFSNNDENITNVGNIAVDSISADAGNLSIALADNVAASLDIKEGNNSYMKFDSTDGSEEILVSKPFKLLDDLALVFGTDSDARIEYDENGSDQLRISAPAAGVVIAGAAPSLTIGDAGAEDTKIVFDGNAQDYYIGLDDTDDIFKIGRGSAVGTNPAITIDASGDAVVEGSLSIIGNLTIEGTTTTVNSSTIAITSSFTFEGATPDAHETVLGVTDPTADATINLPAMSCWNLPCSCTCCCFYNCNYSSTPAEINLIDAVARGSIVYGNASGASALLAKGGANTVLSSDGTDISYSAVSAAMIADNAVSLAKMAGITRGSIIHGDASGDPAYLAKGGANTVLSSDGTDVSYTAVSTAMIADNAISLAKMAGLTRGSIIHGDASGDPAALAKGAANTVLSSDGTDVSYTAVSNAMLAGSIADSKLNQLTTAGKVALSALEIDGESSSVSALDPADLFIVDDGAGGSNKKMAASVLKTFIGSGTSAVNVIGDANATLAVGVNAPSANASAQRTWTLPASAGLTVGESVVIKAFGNAATQPLTIAQAGSQEIDGSVHNLILESDNAAITLYYVAADTWVIV
jgi:hypothetical protein